MVKLISSLFFVLAFNTAFCQMTVSPVPLPQSFSLEDLWNISISGKDTSFSYFKIRVRLQENRRGLLMDISTRPFVIENNSGIVISGGSLENYKPFETGYVNHSELSGINNNGGKVPSGNYLVQYQLYGTPSQNSQTGTYTLIESEYFNHEAVFIQPTELILVFNHDTITEKHPVFNWTPVIIPAAGSDGHNPMDITYTIHIAELLNNQTPYQAITSNAYQYTQSNLNVPFLQYPYHAADLADSGTYVWQVHTYLNASLISSSEIWDFTYVKDDKVPHPATPLMKKEKSQNFHILKDNSLGFSYFEEYAKNEGNISLPLRFYSEMTGTYLEDMEMVLDIKPGMNSFKFFTCPSGINLPDGAFLLELTNLKNEKYYLRILHQLETGCDD
jgi:hypothetical protein